MAVEMRAATVITVRAPPALLGQRLGLAGTASARWRSTLPCERGGTLPRGAARLGTLTRHGTWSTSWLSRCGSPCTREHVLRNVSWGVQRAQARSRSLTLEPDA